MRLTWIEKESQQQQQQSKQKSQANRERARTKSQNLFLKLELEALEAQKPIKLIIKSVLDTLNEISELHLGQ